MGAAIVHLCPPGRAADGCQGLCVHPEEPVTSAASQTPAPFRAAVAEVALRDAVLARAGLVGADADAPMAGGVLPDAGDRGCTERAQLPGYAAA